MVSSLRLLSRGTPGVFVRPNRGVFGGVHTGVGLGVRGARVGALRRLGPFSCSRIAVSAGHAYSAVPTGTPDNNFYDRRRSWIDTMAPEFVQPYLKLARMDRSSGTWLLLLPCWWSQAAGSVGLPDPILLAKFGVGAFVMRGAGCIVNDLWDRNIDKKVKLLRFFGTIFKYC